MRLANGGSSKEAYVRASRGNVDGGEVVVVLCGAEGFVSAVRGYFGCISEVCGAGLIFDCWKYEPSEDAGEVGLIEGKYGEDGCTYGCVP